MITGGGDPAASYDRAGAGPLACVALPSCFLAVLLMGMPPALDLPDFSRAGYRAGDAPLPLPEPMLDVGLFGAVPDDDLDDAPAFQAAIDAAAAAGGGAVRVPPGRWRLEQVLRVDHDGVVLLGAGSKATVLFFPQSLTDLRGPNRNWSWSGGMLELKPPAGNETVVARIGIDVEEGSRRLPLTPEPLAAPIEPGQWLQLQWFNDPGHDTLLSWLHGDVIPRDRLGSELRASEDVRVRSWVRVVAVDADGIEIDPPLALPIRSAWSVRLVRRPHLREVGVRGLCIEFPRTEHPGHLKELGYNAIAGIALIDGWIKDVRIVNADSGIILGGCHRVSIQGVQVTGRTMHHVVSLSWSSDCLVTDWVFEAPQVHGTTISWSSHGNVFSRGRGRELAMDAHRAASFRNLHTDIEIVQGPKPKQPLRSGGKYGRGPHAARENVYWNIRQVFEIPSEEPFTVTGLQEWPMATFAGWSGEGRPVVMNASEDLEHNVMWPGRVPLAPDLHRRQVDRRRAAAGD